ncbi:MAG TPA: hypothetical protein VNK91_05305 [Burkholderiaceae bacterium]|jgi:hypothetical protein|nr:hypothetical protein [Burkholderiaceae bacterium]
MSGRTVGTSAAGVAGTDEPQAVYARLLWWSSSASLALLILAFALYVCGALPPLVALEELPRAWRQSAAQFGAQAAQADWAWLRQLERGDALNLFGIALLSICSLVPLLGAIVQYARRGERLYAGLAALQIGVLLAAASGLIRIGH